MSLPPSFTRCLRGLAVALAFVGGLTSGAWVLGKMQPLADVPSVREKLAHFAAHADDYDTLFIGSSRVYRGIMPSLFDRLTAEAGMPTRSFNFGVDAMFPPEDAFVFERIMAQHPRRLRWVFIEMSMFQIDFDDRQPDAVRTIYWHDLRRTALVSGALLWPKGRAMKWKNWVPPRPDERERLENVMMHWRLFLTHSLNLGRGSFLFDMIARGRRSFSPTELGPAGDGFQAMSATARLTGERLAAYEKQLAQLREQPARIVQIDKFAQSSLDGMLAAIRRAGAQPVLVISPIMGSKRLYPQDRTLPLFDFTDVTRWSELFRPGNRGDAAHLNPHGAEIYTRIVAEHFLELARPPAQPPR